MMTISPPGEKAKNALALANNVAFKTDSIRI